MNEIQEIEKSFKNIKKNYDGGHYVEFPRDRSIQPFCQETAIEILLEDQEILIAEVRRLKEEVEKRTDKICDDQLSLEGKESKIIGLHQESQLYKDLYTKENTKNMVYKSALEFYADENNHYEHSLIDIRGVSARAKVGIDEGKKAREALEVDTK